MAFESMLCRIFGTSFIETFKAKRPAAWVDLTIAFEARKRTAAPSRTSALNISLPFSFIDFYKRHCGQSVETALRKSKYGCCHSFKEVAVGNTEEGSMPLNL